MEVERERGLLACAKRSSTPPFLLKTHMLVEDPATDDIISWNSLGTSFVIWQPSEFARDVLPSLFKHNNFSSFIRQLNTYGFRKASSGRWEFQNDMFRKGEADLLSEIRRRKACSGKAAGHAPTKNKQSEGDDDNGSSSTSTSSEQNSLTDENKRLKRENCQLISQLRIMKSKCQTLLETVAAYKLGGKSNTVAKQEECPKLFGVRLEVHPEKKPRCSEE